MNENDKQVSGVEATANPAPSTGRRRLVKGAIFAIPAIVTLRTSFASQNSGPSIEKAIASFACDNGQPVLNPALVSFLGPNGNIGDYPEFSCPTPSGQEQNQNQNQNQNRRRW